MHSFTAGRLASLGEKKALRRRARHRGRRFAVLFPGEHAHRVVGITGDYRDGITGEPYAGTSPCFRSDRDDWPVKVEHQQAR